MNKINYFFGNGEYKDVLTCLSTTPVNSYKTSSLPLADFWNPKNKELKTFIDKCKEKGLDLTEGSRYFEYPTPCYDKEKKKNLPSSQSSYTDLMIINDSIQAAIECKYTEYSESVYQTIKDWNPNNEPYKNNIKAQWFKYIQECKATSKTVVNDNIPYQFLHRTASACFNCQNKKPVLIYQVFYDEYNEKAKDIFIEDLAKWAKTLGLNQNISFYVFEVRIKNIDKVKEKYNGIKSDLFLIMKELKKCLYEFDWEKIEIHKLI